MKYLKLFLYVLLSGALTSCSDDFLNVNPKGRIIATNTDDYRNLFSNNSLLANGFSDVQQVLGDEISAISSYLNSESAYAQRAFRWEDDLYDDEENATELTTLMAQIYLLNKIANEVMDSENGTEAEKAALRAEARATRAWSYFMFINYYGKPYTPATASTDPGVPIINEADVTTTSFSRASVQEVYDHILSDLTESLPLLPQNSSSRTRMTRAGAEGLLAKVYVFMGRYDEALPLLDAALSHLPTSFAIDLYDYNTLLAPGGGWYFAPTVNTFIGAPLPWASVESLFSRQYISLWSYISNAFLLNEQHFSIYGEADMRRLFYTDRPTSTPIGTTFPVPGLVRKYAPSNVVAYGITMPDLYLLRAECHARAGNLALAKRDLETLRNKRMPVEDANVDISDPHDMIRFVIDERRREFAFTGYRWFDMRRLSVDPLFSGAAYEHILYTDEGVEQSRFTLRTERLTLRFPLKVMAQNPDMQNNP